MYLSWISWCFIVSALILTSGNGELHEDCSHVAPRKPVTHNPPISDEYLLAFTSYCDGSADVFAMKPDGTGLKQLTNTTDANSFARDAGDGKHVIFRRAPAESGYEQAFYRLNLFTLEEQLYQEEPVIEGARSQQYSPNGQWVAFAKNLDDLKELFVYNRKTEQALRITDNREADHVAIERTWWSHDGQHLAYLTGPDFYNLHLRIYNCVTAKTTTITDFGAMYSGVVWLPDDQSFIINTAIRYERSYELFSINIDGSNLKQLTNNSELGNAHPTLSPDGQWVAFDSGRADGNSDVYIMRPDGSAQTRLTFGDDFEGRPAWIKPY